MQNSSSRSIKATKLGIQKLREAKNSQRLTYEKLEEKAGFSLSTVKRFLSGKAVEIFKAECIAQALGLELQEVVEVSNNEPEITNTQSEKTILIHRQVCQQMLVEKRRLTTNPLTANDGSSFDRQNLYVPLGLIERKRQPQRPDNLCAETGSKLYQPTDYEILQQFENDEFFDRVLLQGQTPKSQGRRIAVIGEPGSGKTTLLQDIGDRLFAETETDVALWVSLADLQGKSIEEYLLQVWLKDAFSTARVTSEMEDALVELFNRGRAWLLLDGVDEMGADNSLGGIASQIRGWVAKAKVILTCRLNVWDGGKNALEGFDVYRNLDFSEEQVTEFIRRWFGSYPELGEKLRSQLAHPDKKRICDVIKNPLRLALLCYFWQRRQGSLPKTKAALYRRFIEVFYEWKEEFFPTTSATRKELNLALGKLAIEALSGSNSRFRIPRRQICLVLGETDGPLFQLATKLGWLNQVGVAAEDPDEPVYAFFHPTFEEYFAAAAIEDWQFFINRVPENPSSGIYRIFEPQWKEIILLWLGREDIEDERRDGFLNCLAEFEDNCGNFYRIKAYFLAQNCLSELGKYHNERLMSKILKQCEKWDRFVTWQPASFWYQISFPSSPDAKGEEQVAELLDRFKDSPFARILRKFKPSFVSCPSYSGRQSHGFDESDPQTTLRQMKHHKDYQKLVNALIDLVEKSQDDNVIAYAIELLNFWNARDKKVIKILKNLLQIKPDRSDWVLCKAAETLWALEPGNKLTIPTLHKVLINTQTEEIESVPVACILARIDSKNNLAIATLVNEIRLPKTDRIDKASDALTALMLAANGDLLFLMNLPYPHQVGVVMLEKYYHSGLVIVNSSSENDSEYGLIQVENSLLGAILTFSGEEAHFIKGIFSGDFLAAVKAVKRYGLEHQEWETKYWGYYQEWEKEENWYYDSFNDFLLDRPNGSFVYQLAENFLWSYAKKMSYLEFFRAWNG
jgi:transcriptional regulator with XRE-family HTH domain